MSRMLVRLMMIVVVVSPTCAFAWNDTGHMTAALIAWRRLDEGERHRVSALLKQHPHYKVLLTDKLPAGVNEEEWAFVRGGFWADMVRPGGDTPRPPEITRFHRGDWHYVNIPYVLEEKDSPVNPATLPSKKEPNILTALEENAAILRSRDAKPEDKAVALTWLEHLVGDIHQPLHAVSLYSSMYPTGDRGGNDFGVRVDGSVMRLHSYWDLIPGTSGEYAAVDFLATQIMAEPQSDPLKRAMHKKNTTFESWAQESHRYAISLAYLGGRLRSAPYAEFDAHRITADDVPALPPSYVGNARELAKLRIAQAGYRLADQIKLLLKD